MPLMMAIKFHICPDFKQFLADIADLHILANWCILGVLMVRHRGDTIKIAKNDKKLKNEGIILGSLIFIDFIKFSCPIIIKIAFFIVSEGLVGFC